jgi:hypothetical protein
MHAALWPSLTPVQVENGARKDKDSLEDLTRGSKQKLKKCFVIEN